MSEIIAKPELLLIAGQQQNVGKTTLACNIISRFSREYKIVALKVSPHIHKNTGAAKIIAQGPGYSILEETSTDTNKDTSRMLKSGAEKSFFVQSEQTSLNEALKACLESLEPDCLIVCESAGVREYIKPGVFLMLRQLYCKVCSVADDELFKQADRIVTFTVNGFDIAMDEIKVENGKWIV